MSKRTARITLRMVKDSDQWNELCTELKLLPKKAEAYFEYGEYASLELEVDENLCIVRGRILRVDGLDEQPAPGSREWQSIIAELDDVLLSLGSEHLSETESRLRSLRAKLHGGHDD